MVMRGYSTSKGIAEPKEVGIVAKIWFACSAALEQGERG
jgi:hypothetical protein